MKDAAWFLLRSLGVIALAIAMVIAVAVACRCLIAAGESAMGGTARHMARDTEGVGVVGRS